MVRKVQRIKRPEEDGSITYSHITLEAYDEYNRQTHSGVLHDDGTVENEGIWINDEGNLVTYSTKYVLENYQTLQSTTHIYDQDGKYISSEIYNPETDAFEESLEPPAEDPILEAYLKAAPKAPEIPEIVYTWYPSNTVTTAGLAFRDERPELTDKWYQFNPVDLSQDGVQSFTLVGGSVLILGKVTVEVAGDEVTVNYSTTYG